MTSTGKMEVAPFVRDLMENAVLEIVDLFGTLQASTKSQRKIAENNFIEMCDNAVNRKSRLWKNASHNLHVVRPWDETIKTNPYDGATSKQICSGVKYGNPDAIAFAKKYGTKCPN